jgi:hypothetical protein
VPALKDINKAPAANCCSAMLTCPCCCVTCCCVLQGGMFIFEGSRCVWSHFDQATGAHADFADVIKVSQAMGSGQDCGCST